MMGNENIDNFLKAFKAQDVDEGDYPVFKGTYKVAVNKLEVVDNKYKPGEKQYEFGLTVTDVLAGDVAGGRFLKRWYSQDEEGLGKLMNDLFTAGLSFKQASVAEFDKSLAALIDKTAFVRTWGWTATKDHEGNPLPESEHKKRQSFAFKNQKNVKKLAATAEKVPF